MLIQFSLAITIKLLNKIITSSATCINGCSEQKAVFKMALLLVLLCMSLVIRNESFLLSQMLHFNVYNFSGQDYFTKRLTMSRVILEIPRQVWNPEIQSTKVTFSSHKC